MSLNLNSSLGLRIISALVLMPLVLFAVIYGGWPFLLMMAIVAGIAFFEWFRMAKKLPQTVFRALVGFVYIAVCLAAFVYIRVYFGAGHALCLILCIWASDTGAYFTGKTVGGPKMAPDISPNKTWAGLAGGMIFSGLALVTYVLWIGPFLTDIMNAEMNVFVQASAGIVFVIGLGITIVGQVGDLIESAQKRLSGMKDSGNLIPGHGGILDRVDSLLLVSPFFLLMIVSVHG